MRTSADEIYSKKSARWELHFVRKLLISAVAILTSSQATADDELMSATRQIFKAIPSVIPVVKDNPVTREKVEIGKMQFFDPRISASEIILVATAATILGRSE